MRMATYTTRIWLNVDAPFSRVKVKSLEGTFAAKNFEFIDILVAAIVPGVWETFGILVGQN